MALLMLGFSAPLNNACDSPTAIIELDVNQVKATLLTGGDLWWDRSDGAYNVPKDDPNGVSALFAGGLWIAGVDPGGNLKIAAQTYGSANGTNEFWPGPLDPETGTTDPDRCGQFDRFWEADRLDNEQHDADYADNGIIDNPIPVSIRSWPGRGNPNFSQIFGWDLPDQDLAPFVDRNGDGLYNPEEGDYPKIKGDHAIWWVMNDEGGGNIHPMTQGNPIKMEIHALAYACSSPGNALDYTTFYEFTFINRALEDLNDTQITLWVDPDLGCYLDDYVGCMPNEKMAVVYNEDEEDGDPGTDCPFGIASYGMDIPMLGIKVLESTPNHNNEDVGFSSFMYFENPISGSPGTSDPNSAIEYFNLMRGLWRDGTPLTQGGNGYNPGSTEVVNYAFPDSPDLADGWSMCTENLGAGDRRFLINSGPYNLSAGGGQTTITYAVITQLSADYPCPSYETLTDMGEEIKGVCEALTSTNEVVFDDGKIILAPNPMNNFSLVTIKSSDEYINAIQFFDSVGKEVRIFSNLDTTQFILEKENLKPGVYYLKILTSKNQWYSKKMMIL